MRNGVLDLVVANPLFGVVATVMVYAAAESLHQALGRPSLLHPVLVATASLAALLVAGGLSYETYFAQAFPLHVALGAVVVLLAVPLWRRFPLIRAARGVVAVALPVGGVIAIYSALALPLAAGSTPELLATLAPKSSTTAVAVQVAEGLDGAPALTAVVVISTGIFGAAFGPPLLAAAGVRDDRAVGLALGVASHAIGTARAFQISDTAGAFSTLGMILNALLTIALAPFVLGSLP